VLSGRSQNGMAYLNWQAASALLPPSMGSGKKHAREQPALISLNRTPPLQYLTVAFEARSQFQAEFSRAVERPECLMGGSG